MTRAERSKEFTSISAKINPGFEAERIMVDYEFDWSRFRVETKLTGYISISINHTTKIN